eukprot:m.67204 g.67204  ORF g.67204 m.67204 type:complete len:237 (-) comp18176_c0_seq2:40-750(-)
MAGSGVRKDKKEAAKRYLRSAELGYTASMNTCGELYYNGFGVKTSANTALEFWEKGASLGNIDCLTTLGCWYRDGVVLGGRHSKPVDFTRALGYMERAMKLVLASLSPALVNVFRSSEGRTEAILSDTSIINTYSLACHHLARMYESGRGVTINHEKAVSIYVIGAALGDAMCQFAMGNALVRGRGTRLDPEAADAWFAKVVVHSGCPEPLRNMAMVARAQLAPHLAQKSRHDRAR